MKFRGQFTNSGVRRPNNIQPNFRSCLFSPLSSFAGRFKCNAVQTQRPSVTRYAERMPKVPRCEGSDTQIGWEELAKLWPNAESSIMSSDDVDGKKKRKGFKTYDQGFWPTWFGALGNCTGATCHELGDNLNNGVKPERDRQCRCNNLEASIKWVGLWEL